MEMYSLKHSTVQGTTVAERKLGWKLTLDTSTKPVKTPRTALRSPSSALEQEWAKKVHWFVSPADVGKKLILEVQDEQDEAALLRSACPPGW
ncbi:hypothetical protein H2203_000966 [Taxawa tesnikishii (nom. ined.)]|nr:hypothetical protein H2203_000966 [Dothideales sp. JES 119]